MIVLRLAMPLLCTTNNTENQYDKFRPHLSHPFENPQNQTGCATSKTGARIDHYPHRSVPYLKAASQDLILNYFNQAYEGSF